jgi:flagellar biosynthesis anti-sigma factor FlgM
MSSINNIGSNPQVQRIVAKPIHKSIPTETPKASGTDKVELSGISQMVQLAKRNDIRADKVAAIKAQIQSGTYETDEKLTAAADKLLDDLL